MKVHLILIGLLIYANGYTQDLEEFREGGKLGFRDAKGKTVIPAKYDVVKSFFDGMVAVAVIEPEHKWKWGFIDKIGNELIPLKYDDVRDFSEGLAAVELNKKWGYVDKMGNEVIPFKYNDVRNFSEGLAAVNLNYKWGFVDKTGNEITPFKYSSFRNFFNGFARVYFSCPSCLYGGNFDYIDKTGNEIFKPVLAPYMEQAKHSSKKGTFEVKRPYLIVIQMPEGIDIWGYSEAGTDSMNAQTVNQIKTLIVKIDKKKHTQTYSKQYWSGQFKMSSYSADLIYFDLETKKCIGYDKIPAPVLPFTTDINADRVVGLNDVVRKIGTHLATPK